MYNPDTDLLFPARTLPSLLKLRGSIWQDLILVVLAANENSTEQMAFILMMARLNNCAACNTDSYRAMSGCTACSTQTLKRFHYTDEALVDLYEKALKEVEHYFLAGA
jgi:hypothetical protein